MKWTIDDIWRRCEIEPNSGCWLWRYSTTWCGYAYAEISGKRVRMNRYVAGLIAGRPLHKGEFACHRCDTPICVNPNHLFIGSPTDNARDAASKGRLNNARRGEANRTSLLTESDVLRIRESKQTIREIAADYGISETAAYQVISGATWIHVGGARRPKLSDADRRLSASRAAQARWGKRAR